jgi:hypothetical protein
MRADDDGFINNPKKIQRMIGCSDDDLKLLIMKKFIIPFDSGIVVIKHWKLHNYIQADRYKPTVYQEEKSMLEMKRNKSYTLKTEVPMIEHNECIQNGYETETQIRLDKISIDKINNIPLKKESKTFNEADKEYLLAGYLSNKISERLNVPQKDEKTMQKWSAEFEKMIRLDKYSIEEIKEVLVFSQKHEFWQSNILSASKFRKQYLTLLAQMKSNYKKGGENFGKPGNGIKFNVPKTKIDTGEDLNRTIEELGLI